MAARHFDLHGLASALRLALFAVALRWELRLQELRPVPDRVSVLQPSAQLGIPHRPRAEDFRRSAEAKTSSTPSNSWPSRMGAARIERISASRQAAASTRGSFSASSQRCNSLLCTQAPETPDRVFRRTPRPGALSP